ncbi:LOW QUALITY PROTEIN: hypothetical protein QYF61_005088 [Mycteria americana]|uniref:Reverse transcriptase domain-containing protein n=1 Tax=Mycteria americana TaxID=33587 RepID=A0AAN7N7G4_MYCAM|nr:LOW QUALITY PROTEIN: hypothetical protein QYF61_005088 [Mycteria americana]
MIEFLIHGEAARGVSRTATLDFQRVDFGLFRRLVDRVPWEAALMGKGVQEGWTFFKEEVLKAQERAVPREKIRRAKAELELNLAAAVKDNKKYFLKYISGKRRARENLQPLVDGGGNTVTKDEEKAEVLNAAFASVFNSRVNCSLGTQPPASEDRDGDQTGAPIIQGEMVSDLLHHLNTHKSMGPDEIHPRVLKELADVLTKPLSIIYQQSWLIGDVPVDWRLVNVTPIYKKGRKEDPGNYRPVSLTSVPGKLMEQIILSAITRHVENNQGIKPSQHGFRKGRSCLTNLISFYDKWMRGKAVDVVYLDFSKAFDRVSHSLLLERLAAHGLDGCTLRWIKNWLDGRMSPGLCWRSPLQAQNPPLNHVPKHHIYTSFKYFQGWRLNHFPGKPAPMLDNPFSEVKFPNIQSKPPLAQGEAISSRPIICYLGEETDPHLSTTSFQVVVESDKVSPEPPFLQAEQPQVPQPLLIRLTLHQLRCPSLDTLQHLNVSLVVRGPKLNTVFEVRPHQCRVQGHDHFPSLAGHAIFDTSQDAIGFLGHLGTLLAHVQPAVKQHPQVLFHRASFQPLFPKPVALHRVAVAQVQDLALSLVEPHTTGPSPSIQPVQVPLQSLPTLKQINTPTQLGVVCKLTEGALDPFVQIIDKDIKQNWPQHRALGNTACDRPPTGVNSNHHHSLYQRVV